MSRRSDTIRTVSTLVIVAGTAFTLGRSALIARQGMVARPILSHVSQSDLVRTGAGARGDTVVVERALALRDPMNVPSAAPAPKSATAPKKRVDLARGKTTPGDGAMGRKVVAVTAAVRPPVLVGLLGQYAILRSAAGVDSCVGVGAVFDGYAVRTIDRGAVTLERQGQHIELRAAPRQP